MEFSRIITLLRKERGITQKQAAQDLGVSQALLSHYEKGIRECGLDFVVRVADYYGVSCDYLLGRSAERTGQTLSVEDIPNPESVKDNVYRGSVLPTMNKKLIANSMNILFDKLAACNDKAITTEVSAYLIQNVPPDVFGAPAQCTKPVQRIGHPLAGLQQRCHANLRGQCKRSAGGRRAGGRQAI